MAGQLLTLTVVAYDADQETLAEAPVTLTRVAEDGSVMTYTALTDLAGNAVFSTVNLAQPVEYIASSDGLQSNAIRIEPMLP